LISKLKELLNRNDELEALKTDRLYWQNIYTLVNFLSLFFLNIAEESEPKSGKKYKRQPLSYETLERLHSVA